MAANEELLKEIRENFDYCVTEWADVRKEGAMDMRYRAGDPWDKNERKDREAADRLCLSLDELGQYCNQAINTVRQNKRAIRVTPVGSGATDKTAANRAAMIRGIEYKSKASQAYLTAFEGCIERSYGFTKLATRYESARSRNRELVILPVPDPDVILVDPDAKQADWSDMEYAFEIDFFREGRYRRRWKGAKIQAFSADHRKLAPAWVKDGGIQVASYWKRSINFRDLLEFDSGKTQFLDEIEGAELKDRRQQKNGDDLALCVFPSGEAFPVATRRSEDSTVCQYITSGVEILEENPWAGEFIPIFPCFGKMLYVPQGVDGTGGSKRKLLSLIRLARDAYKLYCYIRTCQAELAGQIPKNLYLGYEGQFNTSTDWANIHRTLTAFAEVKAKTTATGDLLLPLPTRQNWEPAIAALEQLAESCKRAVQSAMSMGSTSVGRHDPSVRSGVAIKELNTQAETGNFHFTDALDTMIGQVGRATEGLLEATYDTERDVPAVNEKDEYHSLHINGPDPEKPEEAQFSTEEGEHEVTISTGPSNDSQRDEVNEFASTIVQMPNAPPKAIALAIRMRNLGPLGDELAACYAPPEDEQPQIPPQIQQQIAASGQMLEQLTATVHELQGKLDSKSAELELKKYTVDQQELTKRTLGLAQLQQADAIALLEQQTAAVSQTADQIHQAEQQQAEQQHQQDMAAQAAAQQPPAEPAPQPVQQ